MTIIQSITTMIIYCLIYANLGTILVLQYKNHNFLATKLRFLFYFEFIN